MNKLKELQAQFQAYMLAQNHAVDSQIANPPQGDVQSRLDVYGHGYVVRLIDTLIIDYPKTQNFLGTKEFATLARTYILENPSQSYSINYFGKDFAEFILKQSNHIHKQFIHGLANFEWMLAFAIDREDSDIFAMDDMQHMPPENWPQLRFSFHPSLQLLSCKWNVVDYYKAIDKKTKRIKPKQLKIEEHYYIWRSDLYSNYAKQDYLEQLAMQALLNGKTFADVCDILGDSMSEDAAANYIANALIRWIGQETIANVS